MVPLSKNTVWESSRREVVFVGIILLTFIAINFSVACRTPTVFPDEPEYSDPAVNLYLGDGFTSTMWAQGRHDFWVGNVPAYQILLAGFFKLFGVGFLQARMVNTLLAALAAGMIWLALKRTELIKTAPYRLLSVVLILSGSVSTQTIRTIRPDTTMFTVCAAVFLAWTVRSEKLRWLAVILASSLLLPAGIPMLPYGILMLGLYMIAFGFDSIKTVAATLAGMMLGVGWLCLFYSYFSSIRNFLDNILPFTVMKAGDASFTQKIIGKFVGDPLDSPDTVFTSFFGKPLEFINPKTLFDYSSAMLFLIILGLAVFHWATLGKAQKKIVIFALLMVLVVPPCLHIAGHYRSMYRWMTYMPLCVLAPCLAESILKESKAPTVRRIVAGIFFTAIVLGIPARTLLILPWWSERSVGPLDAAAERVVTKSDVVIGDCKVYFAVRPLAKTVFLLGLPANGRFDRIKDLPKSEITLLCLKPEELDEMVGIVGGNWQRVASGNPEQENELARTRYNINFYRRVATGEGN